MKLTIKQLQSLINEAMHKDQSYYDILGVSPDASTEEIKNTYAAWDKQRRSKNVGVEKTREPLARYYTGNVNWVDINKKQRAYATLVDPVKRKNYDSHMKFNFSDSKNESKKITEAPLRRHVDTDLYEMSYEDMISFAKAYRSMGNSVADQLDSIMDGDYSFDNVNPNAVNVIKQALGGMNQEIDEAIAAYENHTPDSNEDNE